MEAITDLRYCGACETEMKTDTCLNVDCPEAQDIATRDASRSTAKTTVQAAERMQGAPRAFTSRGNVD